MTLPAKTALLVKRRATLRITLEGVAKVLARRRPTPASQSNRDARRQGAAAARTASRRSETRAQSGRSAHAGDSHIGHTQSKSWSGSGDPEETLPIGEVLGIFLCHVGVERQRRAGNRRFSS